MWNNEHYERRRSGSVGGGGGGGGGIISRFFGSSSKRRSLPALEEKQLAEDLRRHVWAVTIVGNENPMPVIKKESLSQRHSADLGRPRPSKSTTKRRSASISTLPTITSRQYAAYPPRRSSKPVRSNTLPNTMARTVTIQPVKTSRSDDGPPSPSTPSSPGLDPIHEDDFFEEAPTPRSSRQTSTTHSSTQSPTLKSSDSFPPIALNSPRRFSNGSSATSSTMLSRESIRSEMARSSSWSSKTSFDSFESSQWKPGDPRQKRTTPPATRQRSFSQPNELFSALPAEVLEVILEMLKQLHLGRRSKSCATCWMRDLCNISLCSRKWNTFARVALYGDIQLIGADSAAHKKRFKQLHGARLLILRQTLRSNPRLAMLVRSLKVPRPDITLKGMTAKSLEQYDDLVATIVMACPNLESLRGPMFGYDGSFKKIFHALSTRTQLKEMDWLIEPSVFQRQHKGGQGSLSRTNESSLPAKLERAQERTFLDHHRNWSKLNSFSVHCLPGAALAPDNLLTKAFSTLSSLRNLHLCSLPPNIFNDNTLLLLPPVETLSLTHITGITSNGISAFATYASSQPLRKLYLHHTPMASLPALARILSNLPKLSIFSLAQAFPPLMPEADSFTLWMMPYLASTSVTKLHWDITSDRDCANSADDILARSIQAGGFPQLRLLRTPNDPEGIFQDLCRPVERIDLPTDRFYTTEAPLSPIEATVPTSPVRYHQKSPISPKSPPVASPTEPSTRTAFCTDLRAARLAAQSRLEKADANPRFSVIVTDEDGSMVDRFGLAGFIGTMGSNIRYHLLPDVGSMDKKGGMVDPRDLAGDAGEDLSNGKEGCTGLWNQREGVIADKKEKEKWWHTERGRWTRVGMPS